MEGLDQYQTIRDEIERQNIYLKKSGHGYAKDCSNDVIEREQCFDLNQYNRIKQSIPAHLNMLKMHLRQLLLGRMRIRQVGGQYEDIDSELDFGALPDIAMKKENVWINKYNMSTVKNTAVHLLLDSSGASIVTGKHQRVTR